MGRSMVSVTSIQYAKSARIAKKELLLSSLRSGDKLRIAWADGSESSYLVKSNIVEHCHEIVYKCWRKYGRFLSRFRGQPLTLRTKCEVRGSCFVGGMYQVPHKIHIGRHVFFQDDSVSEEAVRKLRIVRGGRVVLELS